jgi:mercuric transport protein
MNRRICNYGIALALILSICGVASAATRTVTLRVKGMSCGGCAISLEQTLKSTDGVEDAKVSYERGEAWIKYDDSKLTVAKLREVIKSAGYQAVTGAAIKRGKQNRTNKQKSTSCCASLYCYAENNTQDLYHLNYRFGSASRFIYGA